MSQMEQDRTACEYWASHLGIPATCLFSDALTILAHAGELTDYNGVFALFRNDSKVVSLPPQQVDLLSPHIWALSPAFTPSDLARALSPLTSKVIGPAFIGYHHGSPPLLEGARMLSAEDVPAVLALQSACTVLEWEHGGSEISTSPCVGVFVGGRLAALAGYEIWAASIAHIAVVTHPSHRGWGHATAAVACLARHAISAGLLPQYRTLDSNAPSLRIAASLGFERYATSLAIRLPPT